MFTFRKLALLVFTSMALYLNSCFPPKVVVPSGPVAGITDTTHDWLSWVAVFKREATASERTAFIDSLRNQLLAVRSDVPVSAADSVYRPYLYYLAKYLHDSLVNPYQISNVQVRYCNCGDSILWNVEADLNHSTDTSGPSIPTSPRPGTGTTVSGDILESIVRNEMMANPAQHSAFIDAASPLTIPAGYRMSSAVVALIDTGIDTLLLDQHLRSNVLWNGADGSKNFVTGEDCNNYNDDHPVRHGTTVASLVLNAFYDESGQAYLPRLMVLKAADSTGHGTVFEFTCALAFAIKNKATVINSSMGFYGEDNPVIDFYLRLARRDSIPVIAAAGNGDDEHTDPLCRSDANPLNMLGPSRLFYPAVLAENRDQYLVISVTGLSVPGRACYFQNFSEAYVTLGVLNQRIQQGCCSFRLPFIADQRSIEGSSFATPVVSGRVGLHIYQQGARANVNDLLSMLGNVVSAPVIDQGAVTQANQYFTY